MSIERVPFNRYVEINSAYRNRVEYPLQARFIVEVGKTAGQGTSGLDSIDPIVNSYPLYSFKQGERAITTQTPYAGGTPGRVRLGDTASNVDGFYDGLTITNYKGGVEDEVTVISSYDGSTKSALLYYPFSDNWDPTDSYTIDDNSQGNLLAATIFDPNGLNQEGYNVGNYLFNRNNLEFGRIIGYDGVAKIYFTSPGFTSIAGDIFEVRRAKYQETGFSPNVTTYKLQLQSGQPRNQYYVGNYIRFVDDEVNPLPTYLQLLNINNFPKYEQYYTLSTKQGTLDTTDIANVVLTDSIYNEIWKYNIGADWYVIYFSSNTNSWNVGTFTSDPDTWVVGVIGAVSDERILTSVSENSFGEVRPSSTLSNITYRTLADTLRLITGYDSNGGLSISNMTNLKYNTVYIASRTQGTLDSDFIFQNGNYSIFSTYIGGNNWNIVSFNRETLFWTVSTSTSDPDNWVAGSIYEQVDVENVTNLTIVPNGLLQPSDASANVTYDSGILSFKPPLNLNGYPLPATPRYEILQFTRDNYGYIDYYGDGNQQQGLYEVELLDLVLPNVTLKNEIGGRIAFYPYVYVEFANTERRTNNIIASNNPNSTSAVFRCPVIDTNSPLISTFVKIDSNFMRQVIQFNPMQDIIFRVFLPDGTLFETFTVDNKPPLPPNEAIQISALFRLTKV